MFFMCVFIYQMESMPTSCRNGFQATPSAHNAWHWMKVQEVSIQCSNKIDTIEKHVIKAELSSEASLINACFVN
jgi:hypothetical protein